MRRATPIVIVALALLLAACSGSPTREFPADQLTDYQQEYAVFSEWQRNTGRGLSAVGDALVPAIEEDKVVVVDRRGRLSAYRLDNGRRLWRHRLDLPVSAGPVLTDELIIVGTRDGRLVAVDRETFERRWESGVTSEVLALPAVDGDTVVVVANDGRVFALRTSTGARRWLYDRTMPPLTLRGSSAPLLTSGRVYVGLPNGRVVALNRSDGALVWEARAGIARGASDIERMRDILGDLVLQQGALFAVSYQGEVVSLDPTRGSSSWNRELSSSAGLAADRERVYVTESNGRIWALDRSSGAAIWRQDETEGLRATRPVVHGAYVVIADQRGALTWLDASTGEIRARRVLRDQPISRPPIVVDDDVIVLSDEGRLHKVSLRPQER